MVSLALGCVTIPKSRRGDISRYRYVLASKPHESPARTSAALLKAAI